MRELSLSDWQRRFLQKAVKDTPADRRDHFLQQVTKQLTSEPVSDAAVAAAVFEQMDLLCFRS